MTRRELTLFIVGGLTALVLMNVTGVHAASRTLFKGAIVMVPAGKTCPSGWSTVNELSNRFPRGGTTVGTGGSSSHSHSVAGHSHTMAHTHTQTSHTHSTPSHTHSLWIGTQGAEAFGNQSGFTNQYYVEGTYSDGGSPHTHDVVGDTGSGGSGTTGSGGSGTTGGSSATSTGPNTASTSGLTDQVPPYYTVRFCKSR